MADRASEQAALGLFLAWIRAKAEGDQFVRFHSRFLDGTNGGIKCVRIEVDGVVLAVVPDPASQAMLKAEMIRNLSGGAPDGRDDASR